MATEFCLVDVTAIVAKNKIFLEMLSKSKLAELVEAERQEELKRKLKDEFKDRTNRQNLQAQLNKLVRSAKKCYKENLEERRNRLRMLLQSEVSAYEEEFIRKVKARVEENVRERQESLMALKIQKAKEAEEFVKKKKIQLYINNCDDIRLALRNSFLKETKECQLKQIEQSHQKNLKEQAEECLWLQVRKRIEEEQDKRQRYEDCLKKILIEKDKKALDRQILEHKQAKEIERKEAYEQRLRIQEMLLAESQGAASAKEFEQKKKKKQAEELKAQLIEGIKLKQLKQQNDAYFECLFTEEVNRQREQEEQDLRLKQSSLREAALRYLEYLHKMKKERQAEQQENNKAFELYQRRAECEKLKKIEEIKIQKQNEAKKAHQELLKQICGNEERKLKQIQAEYESALVERKIFENQLREEKMNELKKNEAASAYARDLLKQIEEIRCFEAMEKKRFEEDLRKALEEEDHCIALAKKYIEENIDYLPPHPNWKLISCPCEERS